jgi:hypothetical protein
MVLLGQDRLVSEAARAYAGLPTLPGPFRDDLARQVRAVHGIALAGGTLAVAAWLLASARRVDVAAFLLSCPGAPWPSGGRAERLRTLAVAAALAYGMLVAPLRLVRDAQLETELRGLSYAERRLVVYGRHTLEPDYRPVAAFQQRASRQGDVVVLRRRARGSFNDVFVASFLFPQRVYFVAPSECTPEAAQRARASYPRAAWVDWDCDEKNFTPEKMVP